jgi:hypothetical protein
MSRTSEHGDGGLHVGVCITLSINGMRLTSSSYYIDETVHKNPLQKYIGGGPAPNVQVKAHRKITLVAAP